MEWLKEVSEFLSKPDNLKTLALLITGIATLIGGALGILIKLVELVKILKSNTEKPNTENTVVKIYIQESSNKTTETSVEKGVIRQEAGGKRIEVINVGGTQQGPNKKTLE